MFPKIFVSFGKEIFIETRTYLVFRHIGTA